MKSKPLDTAAAGYRWTARFLSADGRPRDGSLKQTWTATQVCGPLYLTAGLLRHRNVLSGFGAHGGHTVTLMRLGTDPKLAAEDHPVPYFVKGAWFVDEVLPASRKGKPATAYLRLTELRALARPGAAPFFRTLTKRLPDGRATTRDRSWNASFFYLLFARASNWKYGARDKQLQHHELKPVEGLGGVRLSVPLEVFRHWSAYKGTYDRPRMRTETRLSRYASNPLSPALARCPYPLKVRAWTVEETLDIEGGYLHEEKKVTQRTFGPE